MKDDTPAYYNMNGIEPIDIIRFLVQNKNITNPMVSFFYGNAIKYICRLGAKDGFESDIDKAIHYLNRMKEEMKNEQSKDDAIFKLKTCSSSSGGNSDNVVTTENSVVKEKSNHVKFSN